MKYAVIGTGYWGSNHVRIGAELKDMGLVDDLVLCDIDENRVSSLADSYGVSFVTDYTELIERGIDAATIATPSPTHRDIAIPLLQNSIDLLVEKPLALTTDDARTIVNVAENENRTLSVGHIFRFHPALTELKRRVDRGELGELKYLNTTRYSFRVPRTTAGVLFSLAVHDVDISNYLLGDEPNTIYCHMDSRVRQDVDETTTLILDYGEATSVINESWQVPVFDKRRDLIAIGDEKSAYIDYLEDNIINIYNSRITHNGNSLKSFQEGKQRYEVENHEPLRLEVENFIQASKGETSSQAPGEIGARTVELLELAELSNKEDRVVSVPK